MTPHYRISIAPMMERTDRHYRYFMRRITRRALLYTEMLPVSAILHGDRKRLLDFDPDEHPLALQIGGDDPHSCAEAVRIASDWGYDEFNLNVGCPSARVSRGGFGAYLMAYPQHTAEIIAAMRSATDRPVTIKHRIGIETRQRYADLFDFVRAVSEAGAVRCIIHARLALLHGLSPKQNRSVPPLRYDDVYRLKIEKPELPIELNGHIDSIDSIEKGLRHVDGVMIGRAAYDNPWLLADCDRRYYDHNASAPTRREVIAAMSDYCARWQGYGTSSHAITRHMLGLMHAQPQARQWRRILAAASGAVRASDGLLRAAAAMPDAVLDARPAI